MLSFDKILKRKWLIGGIVGLVAIFCVSYAVSSTYFKSSTIEPEDVQLVKQDAKIKVTQSTDVVQRIIYTKCNDEEIIHTMPAENLMGLNFLQVQKMYAGWNMEKFDTDEVVLTLKTDSLCKEHANNMFIGVKDGYVAVYYGKPGDKAILKEVTLLSVAKITPEDMKELEQGVIVESREQLLRTLEGMQAR